MRACLGTGSVLTEGLTLLMTGWYLGRRNTEMWLTQMGEGEGLVCIVDVSIDMIGLSSSIQFGENSCQVGKKTPAMKKHSLRVTWLLAAHSSSIASLACRLRLK